MFDTWRLYNDIKKGRCSNLIFNEEQANFDTRRISWMIKKGRKIVNKVKTKGARGGVKAVNKSKRLLKGTSEETLVIS